MTKHKSLQVRKRIINTALVQNIDITNATELQKTKYLESTYLFEIGLTRQIVLQARARVRVVIIKVARRFARIIKRHTTLLQYIA